jgi:hypothetical protein
MRTIEYARTQLARFEALQGEFEAARPVFTDAHRMLTDHDRLLLRTSDRNLRQVREGADAAEPTDPALGDLIRDPAVQALRLRRPCIATITALIEQLGQQAAGEPQQHRPQAGRYRLRTEVQIHPRAKPAPAGPHIHEGRLVLPGEEVLLTEAQAQAWADKFDPVMS